MIHSQCFPLTLYVLTSYKTNLYILAEVTAVKSNTDKNGNSIVVGSSAHLPGNELDEYGMCIIYTF